MSYKRTEKEFWTNKQRQACSIHEVSYRACFKPQLPKYFIDKYWDNFHKTCRDRHDPFEKYINEIYKKEICVSPLKSLSVHLTNVNSSYGLSPCIIYKNLWDQNK